MWIRLSITLGLTFTCFSQAFAQLAFLGDGSKDLSLNKKFCPLVIGITQSSTDDLAIGWGVDSNSIRYRGSRVLGPACCITLDTPRGPFTNGAWQYYSDGKNIYARMNNRGYRPGEQGIVCIY